LIRALADQGRGREAATVARDGLALLRALKGTGFSELAFRAAAVEALDGAGEREEAARVLREACLEIEARAARIPDPEMRHSFVSNVADNRRVLELARAWGTAG
jgi:2-hydroxychromene-2-carboxylate isomerase